MTQVVWGLFEGSKHAPWGPSCSLSFQQHFSNQASIDIVKDNWMGGYLRLILENGSRVSWWRFGCLFNNIYLNGIPSSLQSERFRTLPQPLLLSSWIAASISALKHAWKRVRESELLSFFLELFIDFLEWVAKLSPCHIKLESLPSSTSPFVSEDDFWIGIASNSPQQKLDEIGFACEYTAVVTKACDGNTVVVLSQKILTPPKLVPMGPYILKYKDP